MDYLEFIVRATSHIHDKRQVMVRFHGLYSNVHRGKAAKRWGSAFSSSIIEDNPSYLSSKGLAEMIRKVYEIDPLLCPSCGGKMSIISLIEELKTINRIIRHLELTSEAE